MKLAVFVTSRFELTWSCRVHARGFVFLFFCFFFPPLFTKMTTMTEPRWLSQVSRRSKNLPPLFGRSIRKYFALSIGTFFFFFPPACMLSPSPIYQSNNEKQDRRYIFSCIVRMYVYIGETTLDDEMKKMISCTPRRTPIEELLRFWAITRFPNL